MIRCAFACLNNKSDMPQDNYCIIMGGGIGSRFWPSSRADKPKQFLDIFGTGRSLLKMTFDRFSSFIPKENILIVTNAHYKDLVLEQLPEIKPEQVLLEPMRRNTAPCIAYACYHIRAKSPNANIIVSPADHLILDEPKFVAAAQKALAYTKENQELVTLGIRPSRPETGYGYIQMKKEKDETDFRKVKVFTEKPSLEFAKAFVESGDFLWNSGMFVWHINAILTAFERHLPEIYDLFNDGKETFATEQETDFINDAFPRCPSVSIDYGVMEKAENVIVLPVEFGWADLGTWGSLYELKEKDEQENVSVRGKAAFYEAKGNLVSMEDPNELVVVQGIDDCIITQSDRVLLICKREEEQRIKEFMNEASLRYDGEYD